MMATPGDDFKKALTIFQNRLTQRELDDFRFASHDEVLATISKIQIKQGTERRMVNINRAKRFIEGMNGFCEVLKIFGDSHIFVAAIWGPVKFLLRVSIRIS